LEQVLLQARQAFVCDAASVLVGADRGRPEVLAATEPQARQADLLQVQHGAGPALRSGGDQTDVQFSGDVGSDARWLGWGTDLAELGWSSVLTMPLVTPEGTFGMLTLYARRPGAFDATHAYAARIFADYATTVLAGARHAAELAEAIHARRRVNLAQGILIEQHGLGAQEAFDLLRRHAGEQQLKLSAAADQVLEQGGLANPSGAGAVQDGTGSAFNR
jgi:transcriptional regulator with GAF, ATPase, and Fis domain